MRNVFARPHFLIACLVVAVTSVVIISVVMPDPRALQSARSLAMPLNEPYRPHYHFTPPANWMNDPNGLVYYAGEYHLFYQHNPEAAVWGPMHWGHAVSRDLINWEHLPIALWPDDNGAIFSGSAVIDWDNTAGFGPEAMVAVFTHADGNRQSQSLAYSTDRGRTWTKYAGNPLLAPPKNIKNFRDPKVFWYGDRATGHWVMALAAGNAILFYISPDLLHWEPSGGFGFGYGSTAGVWETPDLFELPIVGGLETRWVMVVGVGDGSPAGGSGTQYFIGHFDGKTFTSDNPKDTILWADFGADFYAAQSWSDEPNGRRLLLGWMSNWRYANVTPTATWRSAFTLPREVSLTAAPDGVRLVQQPIGELEGQRGEKRSWRNQSISAAASFPLPGSTYEIVLEFPVTPDMEADRIGFRLRAESSEPTTIGYATKSQTLFVQRHHCDGTSVSPDFPGTHLATLEPSEGVVRLRIFVDRSSVEVFGNDGRTVITDQIFPCADAMKLEVFADGGEVVLTALDIYELRPATFTLPAPANQ